MPDFHLGWQIPGQDELSLLKVTQDGQGQNASDYARELVLNQDVWGVILINPNATVLATQAAQNGNAAYDPRGAITFYYEEARNFYATDQYVSLMSTRLIKSAIAQASQQFTAQFLDNAAPNRNGGAANPGVLRTALTGNALTYPFYFSQVSSLMTNSFCHGARLTD